MIFFKSLYYVLNLRDHHLNKKKILSTISQRGQYVDDGISKISNTDWLYQRDGVVLFDWYNYSLSEGDRKSYAKLIYKKFGKGASSVQNIWFNQYDPNSGSNHSFHNHYSELRKREVIIEVPKPPGPSDSFSLSQMALQLRYRWEIAPLSDIFVVYTRQVDQGSALKSFSNTFSDGYENPVVNALTFKLRYRFGS